MLKDLSIPVSKYKYFFKLSSTTPWNTILFKLRKECDCSQEYIARRLGIARETYRNYESGLSEIKIETIKQIAQLYKIPSSILLGEPQLMTTFMEEITHD